jgi:hypothetical protein
MELLHIADGAWAVCLAVSIVCAGCSLRIGSCGAMLLCWCFACDMRCAARSAEAGVTGGVERAHQGALVADRSGLVLPPSLFFVWCHCLGSRVDYSWVLHFGKRCRPWKLVEGINQCAAVEAGT